MVGFGYSSFPLSARIWGLNPKNFGNSLGNFQSSEMRFCEIRVSLRRLIDKPVSDYITAWPNFEGKLSWAYVGKYMNS
jgi:hypothetical protein